MRAKDMIIAVETVDKPIFTNETERCLYLAGIGKWDEAHAFVEKLPEPGASWIHAMLHREEGDKVNAKYWYLSVDKRMPKDTVSFMDEWKEVVKGLLT
jgi:hypothetical protein